MAGSPWRLNWKGQVTAEREVGARWAMVSRGHHTIGVPAILLGAGTRVPREAAHGLWQV